jgi:hypothetical protein
MSFENISSKIVSEIQKLAEKNCFGCKTVVSSWKNHSCYKEPWIWHVGQYFEQAITLYDLDIDLLVKKQDCLNYCIRKSKKEFVDELNSDVIGLFKIK